MRARQKRDVSDADLEIGEIALEHFAAHRAGESVGGASHIGFRELDILRTDGKCDGGPRLKRRLALCGKIAEARAHAPEARAVVGTEHRSVDEIAAADEFGDEAIARALIDRAR